MLSGKNHYIMNVLNLHAGLGGNRKLWTNCNVTAVELNPEIAKVYQKLYPDDTVIVSDASEYLLANYNKYDFIWLSPPCQSHSSIRFNLQVRFRGCKPVIPDMSLYAMIVFLKTHYRGKWSAENVVPYYEPLIAPTRKINRHLYWSNFQLSDCKLPHENIRAIQIPQLQVLHGIDLNDVKIKNKRQVLRNCVSPLVGLSIYNDFLKSLQ